MPDVASTDQVSFTTESKLPVDTGTLHNYTNVVSVDLGNTTTVSKKVADWIKDVTSGMGRVDLVKIEVAFIGLEAGAIFKAGIKETGSSLTLSVTSMKPNGIYHVSNAKNCGEKIIVQILPEDLFSRQIKPAPCDLPIFELEIEKNSKMNAVVYFYLINRGITVHNITLN
jgi:hypothetical protein